jgi:tRNA nucleotidyltransferase (CCA-adding enzyme)
MAWATVTPVVAEPDVLRVEIADAAAREAVESVARAVRDAGGRALLVGGCVRDAALGLPAEDLDLEVHGLAPDRLERVLAERHPFDRVGRAFGVLRLRGVPIDIAVPRRHSRAGVGRGDLEHGAEPDLGPRAAAARRDFTCNAIAQDPLSGETLDPLGGLRDLAAGVLRHASGSFGDDPLRVLRAMQLAARFELSVAPETVALCRGLEPAGLARERVFGEWRKLIGRGRRPSLGLAFLRDCGWIRHTPELEALIGCPQDPVWHPEGDVWIHTLHCLDAFALARVGDPREDLVVGLAVLCHDLGKPAATREQHGRIRALRHDAGGVAPTREFLGRMTDEHDLIEEVAVLVAAHLRPMQLHEARASDAAVRRLARRVGRIDRLARVARADWAGRPPLPAVPFAAGDWLEERARALEVGRAAPVPLVRGRHLIALGLAPGPEFGEILDACYTAQIEGDFTSEAQGIALARRLAAQRERP